MVAVVVAFCGSAAVTGSSLQPEVVARAITRSGPMQAWRRGMSSPVDMDPVDARHPMGEHRGRGCRRYSECHDVPASSYCQGQRAEAGQPAVSGAARRGWAGGARSAPLIWKEGNAATEWGYT